MSFPTSLDPFGEVDSNLHWCRAMGSGNREELAAPRNDKAKHCIPDYIG